MGLKNLRKLAVKSLGYTSGVFNSEDNCVKFLQFFKSSFLVLTVVLSAFNTTNSLAQNNANTNTIKIALIESFSGPLANTGDAVIRNIQMAVDKVNQEGGINTPTGKRLLQLQRYDNKGQVDESLNALRLALDDGAQIVMQGNSSAVALALVDAINKNNEREPQKQVVFLNYSAVDPILTNEKCSFWHFRFDAHADMRMTALMHVLKQDSSVKNVYLIGQDYSFGQAVLKEAKSQIQSQRPDIKIVGEELHPIGKVKDFSPYIAKIMSAQAQAVMTGNWGNDLTLLVKAAKEAGYTGKFYTFYGNALGAPSAIGDAGIGKVIAVADWLPNWTVMPGLTAANKADQQSSDAFYAEFKQRYNKPQDDYVHARMHLLVKALELSLKSPQSVWLKASNSINAKQLALNLEKVQLQLAGQTASMRAQDHQLQQPLMVGVMEKAGTPGVKYDVEGSGYGFKVLYKLNASQAQMPSSCVMKRPS